MLVLETIATASFKSIGKADWRVHGCKGDNSDYTIRLTLCVRAILRDGGTIIAGNGIASSIISSSSTSVMATLFSKIIINIYMYSIFMENEIRQTLHSRNFM